MIDTLCKEVHYILDLTSAVGLPESWWNMGFDQFLTAGRGLIGRVIRAGYNRLSGGGG